MRWKNALKDGVPADREEVIVCVNGVDYYAVFDAMTLSFAIDDGQALVEVGENMNIYWIEKHPESVQDQEALG